MTVAANRLIGAAADVARLHLPADPILLSGSNLNGASTKSVQFGFPATDLPAARRDEFKADFSRDLARVEQWMADRIWSAMASPALRVVVSDRFRISKSLVPAWSGQAGEMQFPTWRVAARKAAIAHELVHVFLPNGNRLLAEGLAVYLQAEIGGNPAFPNFGRPLHDLVRELAPKMVAEFRFGNPASLEGIHFTDLDAIATPSPLTLKIGNDVFGEEPRGQAHIYPLAGSFVQHLVETRGIEAFRGLYALTPLVPLHRDAGVAGRWVEIYGLPLQSLEVEWRSMIAGR
ncbi:MAG: hypothetical protein ACRD9W_25600 [Terriglobia bacterium]